MDNQCYYQGFCPKVQLYIAGDESFNLFQPFFGFPECNYCECYLRGGDEINCCQCPRTQCTTGCVCLESPFFSQNDYICCECHCQRPGGGTQGCNSCECGYLFEGDLAYCKPCGCLEGICFNTDGFPECCENCPCGVTDIVPGKKIVDEFVID